MPCLKRSRLRRTLLHTGLLWLLLLTPSAGAAESLLSLVGDQTGFCLHVRELPTWRDRFEKSPLFERLQESGVWRQLNASPGMANFKRSLRQVEALLGRPIGEAVRDALGDEFLIAIDPTTPDRPTGILLASPNDREGAARLIDLWNTLEPADVKSFPDGYFSRTAAGHPTVYYFLDDGLLALSDREAAVRDIAALRKNSERHARPLLDSPAWQRARSSLPADAWATAYFRPALWRDVLPIQSEAPGIGPLLRQLAECDSIAAGFAADSEIWFRINVLLTPDQMPPAVRARIADWSAPPQIHRERLPEALVTASGQDGLAPLLRLIQSLPESRTREFRGVRKVVQGLLLGLDPFDDVAPQLGPEWSLQIVPETSGTFPVGALAALDLRPGEPVSNDATVGPELTPALDNLLQTGLQVWMSQVGRDDRATFELKSETIESAGTLRWIEGMPEVQPAYLVTPGRIWIATSPALIRRSLQERNTAPDAGNPSPPSAAELHQFVHVDLQQLHAELVRQQSALSRERPLNNVRRDTPAFQFDRELVNLFTLCDDVVAGMSVHTGEVRLLLSLSFSAE